MHCGIDVVKMWTLSALSRVWAKVRSAIVFPGTQIEPITPVQKGCYLFFNPARVEATGEQANPFTIWVY